MILLGVMSVHILYRKSVTNFTDLPDIKDLLMAKMNFMATSTILTILVKNGLC